MKSSLNNFTMDHEELAAANLSAITGLLRQLYPYSFKGSETDPGAHECSLLPSGGLASSCDADKVGYTQVHTQLPVRLASELRSALPIMGFSNMTEWVRDKARETIRAANCHIQTKD